ncbi:ABC transporter permease [Nocardioides marmorisolisilvae]|uniref:ABC transporter permease n=1 Tax=Nocardioides marmorisolisilvae TaxID=1542737 RepID=A0A3N0DPP9_9ACTN|nr:ABC transporter permease [Nocardioides marmorisolisilvae]RNL77614.1 ABC transporter permease [Nocardioides marmorisolisilvae]
MTNLIPAPVAAALKVKNAGVAYALALLVAALSVIASQRGVGPYLSATNTTNIIDQSALIGLLAITTTIVLVSGNFDLSIASNAALSAVVFVKVINAHGPAAGVSAALLVGLFIGLLNGVLVQLVGINAFIVTLATLTAARGAMLPLTNSQTVQAVGNPLGSWTNGEWTTPDLFMVGAVLAFLAAAVLVSPALGRGLPLAAFVAGLGAMSLLASTVGGWTITLTRPSWYMLGLAAVVGFVFTWTIVGRRLFAVGGNAVAARLVGISVTRYKIAPFVVSGVVSSFVGVLFASRLGAVNPEAMSGWELTAIAAAILGGTSLFGGSGSAFKSVVGALILAVLTNGFNILNVGSEWQQLVQGAVILTAAGTYTVAARRASRHTAPAALVPETTGSQNNLGVDARAAETVMEGSVR